MRHTALEASPQAVRGRKRQIVKIHEQYRLQLFRMCKLRHRNHFVPDSAEGRALLKALLRCKLGGEAVMHAAPWLEPGQLQALQRAARRLRLHDIGTQVHLTYAERHEGKLWLLRPCDVPWDEVQRQRRERSVKADRERKRKKRQEQRERREMIANTPRREDAILLMLSTTDWMPVSEMVRRARTLRRIRHGELYRRGTIEAFRAFGGGALSSLRKLVHRTLDRLEALGSVETDLRQGTRGLERFARKVDLEGGLRPDGFRHRDSVTGGILCRKNAKMDDRTTALGVTNIVRSKRAKSVRGSEKRDGRTPIQSRNDPPAAKPQEGHPSSEATSDSQHLPSTEQEGAGGGE